MTPYNSYQQQLRALDSAVTQVVDPGDGGTLVGQGAYNIAELSTSGATYSFESAAYYPLGTQFVIVSQESITVGGTSFSNGEAALYVVTKDSSGDHKWDLFGISSTAVTNSFGDDDELSFGDGDDAQIGWETGDASNHTLVVGLGDSNQSLHITDKGAIATDWNIAADTHPTVYVHSNTTPATDYLAIGGHDGTTADIDVVGGTTLTLSIAGTAIATVTASGIALADDDAVILGTGSDASLLFDGSNTILDTASGSVFDVQVNSTTVVQVSGSGLDLADSVPVRLGTGNDATLLFDGTDTVLDTASGGVIDLQVNSTTVAQVSGSGVDLADSVPVRLGTGNDATIQFDGTQLVISPLSAGGDVHVGDSSDTSGNQVHIFDGGADDPGLLVLYDAGGSAHYLWVDTTGDLRVHTAAPTDEDADGTVVGSQS